MLVSFLTLLTTFCFAGVDLTHDAWMHPYRSPAASSSGDTDSDTASYWQAKAQSRLEEKLSQHINTNKAKNVILFLGDGMSIPTLKGARVYNGQLKGGTGLEQEQERLAFEEFPHVGLSRTYCTDAQVPDSACTATAYLCGVKARTGTVGVTGAVYRDDCNASLVADNQVTSIARWSQLANKRTGLVTSTRVTHASPAGVYAHSSDRDWEYDTDGTDCNDIAYQLIYGETGRNLNVIMGGGRKGFLPTTVTDDEGDAGKRTDGLNLIETWLDDKELQGGQYIWNRDQLLNLTSDTQYVLGLFESDHLKYHLEDDEDQPTLEEMTEAAINILDNENGFFLFVEGGKIDHAHHSNLAKKALDEAVELSKAVKRAREITSVDDTLIVVTSDHAHVMSISGYADIGDDILGQAGTGSDGYPYTVISYANGPGYKENVDDHRYDLTDDDTTGDSYAFPTTVPLSSESHGGDDVGIFASGPWSHLFTGSNEENVIPHLMAYASCVGHGHTADVCHSS